MRPDLPSPSVRCLSWCFAVNPIAVPLESPPLDAALSLLAADRTLFLLMQVGFTALNVTGHLLYSRELLYGDLASLGAAIERGDFDRLLAANAVLGAQMVAARGDPALRPGRIARGRAPAACGQGRHARPGR